MNYVIDSAAGRLHRGQIGDGPNMQGDLAANRGQIFFLTGREIVEHHDVLPSADEFLDNVRTDKAGSAGNEIAHAWFSSAADMPWKSDGIKSFWQAPKAKRSRNFSFRVG